jgi:hypothetical protein
MTEALTARQRAYREALVANLEKNTGRSLAGWLGIARACPERTPRARLRWFKHTHGLGQNSAMCVLEALDAELGQPGPQACDLRATLWAGAETLAILKALEAALAPLPQVITGQRKGYTSWSRAYAFAAARPQRGLVRLGLALTPEAAPTLRAASREVWSERLKSTLVLTGASEVDDALRALLHEAWLRS